MYLTQKLDSNIQMGEDHVYLVLFCVSFVPETVPASWYAISKY